ncbi:dynamin family protein [Streptomyces sp. NPDC058682]|uniref:dynamin family protein n=1 Tax=Streptomyces sp. NPDC058682 TaxID=3346596 RepID=UPI00364D5792
MTEQLVVDGPGAGWTSVVSGHLRWIEGQLDGLGLPTERSDELRARLLAVQVRAADPRLRVAVFGEASSGKSTLLNAFLRRRLLPSSALVTTRTTTVLEYREGGEGLMVRTADGPLLEWPSVPFATWAGRRRESGPDTLERALQRVLTTTLADEVASLRVFSPVRLLGGGVTVIDTPGFNVTERGHRELAEAAARQADVALVVVPAVAALSLTLVDFLTGPLSDHHDRCAFVLTKLDLLDEDERSEAVAVVERRLRDLGCADPLLLPCSPGKALGEVEAVGVSGPGELGGSGGSGELGGSGHLASFLEVEARIAQLAADSRRSAVAATTLGLLSELLSAVEETAEARRTALGRGERELATLTLPDFPAFLDTWAARTRHRAATELNPALSRTSPQSRTTLEVKVGNAVAGEKINDLAGAAEEVSRLVRNHLRQDAQQAVRTAAKRAGEVLTTAAAELARDFAAQYSALVDLAGETRTAAPVPPVVWPDPPAPDMSGIDRALSTIGTQLTTSGKWRTGGGAMAGALAGGLVVPGIGAVVGGVLGALIGRRGPDATREQFLQQVSPVIAAAHEEIGALAACLPRVEESLTESVAAIRRQYDDEWREEIARLTAAHEGRRAELAAGIAHAEETAATARRRRDEIAALRRHTSRNVPNPEEP